jgi:hypothetical protein
VALTESRRAASAAWIAWRNLTQVERDAWDAAAGANKRTNALGVVRNLSGYGAYVSCWVRQTGNAVVTAPVLAGALVAGIAITPRYYLDGLDLKVSGYDRAIAVGETVQHRVLTLGRQSVSNPFYKLQRTLTVGADDGLGLGDELAQTFSGSASRIYLSGLYSNQTTHTIEMWVRPHLVQTNASRALWDVGVPSTTLMWSIGASMYFDDSGTWRVIGAALPLGTWRYIACVMDAATGKCDVYVNGVHYGSQVVYTPRQMDTHFCVGAQWSVNNRIDAEFDEIRVSRVARSAAEILANWNGGIGRHFPLDATTEGLYLCDAVVGGLLLDSTIYGRNLTAVSLTAAAGAFNRMLYAGSECSFTTGRRVWVKTQTGAGGIWIGKCFRSYYDWA